MWNVTCISHTISRSLVPRKNLKLKKYSYSVTGNNRLVLRLEAGEVSLFWVSPVNILTNTSGKKLLPASLGSLSFDGLPPPASGVMCECVGILTALTLDSSLQVLSSPFCSTSFCWTRLCTAAALEPLCSLSSWLADSRAVSSVCCHTTRTEISISSIGTHDNK